MDRYIIDSSAWIEYFAGTEKGRRIKEIILGKEIFTTGVIVAEVSTHFLKKGLEAKQAVIAMKAQARLLPFDFLLGERAAEMYVKERKSRGKFGLVDAHVVAAARLSQASILTCDFDFLGMSEAIVVK